MKPIKNADFSKVKAVFFDIDDTFSTEGKIKSIAYQALWKLHYGGFICVPVTGRPAGWCDFIARMWPVNAVVGENGAFYQYLDHSKGVSKLKKTYLESNSVRKQNQKKLDKLRKGLFKKYPQIKLASDQFCREFDLAIDFCEDVAKWKDQKIEEVLKFCRDKKAQAKLSSIHINTWYGKYDKWTCVSKLLKNHFKLSVDQIIYIGDSPNDEPFFAKVPLSIGVANIHEFSKKLQFQPAFVTDSRCGAGFAEVVEALLSQQAKDKRLPSNLSL